MRAIAREPAFLRASKRNKRTATPTGDTNTVQKHTKTHQVDTSAAPKGPSSTPNDTEKALSPPQTT